MKYLSLLLIASALGSCGTAPPVQSAEQITRAQAQLADLTAGKVAGPPVSCLSHHASREMIIIPGGTVAFRDSSRRIYVNNMGGGCPNLRDTNTLVTRPVATTSLCRGDIAQVLDTSSHIFVGSCVFGDFVPFTRPGA